MAETLNALQPRRAGRRAPGSTWSARWRSAAGSAGTSCRATSTAPARSLERDPVRALGDREGLACPPSLARYVVEKGSITVDGVSLTVVDAGRRLLHRQPDPDHPRADHARRQAARRPGQPRGRRHRQVRRAAARRPRHPGRRPAAMSSHCHWLNAEAFTAFGQHIMWSDMIGNLLGLVALALGWRRSMLDLAGPAAVRRHPGRRLRLRPPQRRRRQAVRGDRSSRCGAGRSGRAAGSGARTAPSPSASPPGRERGAAGGRHGRRHRSPSAALFTAVPLAVLEPLADAYIFVGTLVAMVAQARGWSSSGSPGSPSTWSACRWPSTAASPSPAWSTSSTSSWCRRDARLVAAHPYPGSGREPRQPRIRCQPSSTGHGRAVTHERRGTAPQAHWYPTTARPRPRPGRAGHRRHRRRAARSWSSTTRTGRTRATSSSPPRRPPPRSSPS